MTDSRAVALAFGKKHKNVLRTIEGIRASKRALIAEHGRLNFEPSSYLNAQSKTQPMFRMTAKGLTQLTMGFSGDDACEVRIRFIDAFEQVAARLQRAERSLVEQLHALEQSQRSLLPN